MNDRTYVYAIHVATTPKKLWEALTSDAFFRHHGLGEWRVESDWKTGSPIKYFTADGKFYSQGEVLESSPPNKLSYTWPEPPDQMGARLPRSASAEAVRSGAEPERLTWQISESGPGTVLLKLIHDRLTEDNYQGVSEGWPAILSSLKSLLERGTPLVFHSKSR